MLNNKFNWLSFLAGLLAGMFILYLINGQYIRLDKAAFGESIPKGFNNAQATELITKRVRDVERIDKELKSYTADTGISKKLQEAISGNSGASNGFKDTLKGITFDLEPILKSIMTGQGISSISDLIVKDHGIYVALGSYPDKKPDEFPKEITDSIYNVDFRYRQTSYVNYVSKVFENGGMTYRYIVNPKTKETIGDNWGNRCKPNCPGGGQ